MIAEKSYRFAVRIVKLCQLLRRERHEFILSKQLERSGTSIRANVTEGQQGQSRADFYRETINCAERGIGIKILDRALA